MTEEMEEELDETVFRLFQETQKVSVKKEDGDDDEINGNEEMGGSSTQNLFESFD